MERLENVAVVGVGLIGGSIGMALLKRGLATQVVGIGRRQVSLRTARRMEAVTNTTIDISKGVAKADLVIVCTPVGQIVDHVRQVAKSCPKGTLITDCGSTKQSITEELDGKLPRECRFLGSHPLAGSEKGGPANATADLFEGRVAIITPTKNTKAEDFDLLDDFWSGIGSVVIKMTAEQHDQAVATTSHLPHMVASALAGTVPEEFYRISGTGLRDSTRIAGGDPKLWKQIFSLNRENILKVLKQYELNLSAFRNALSANDQEELERLLTVAKKNRDALGS